MNIKPVLKIFNIINPELQDHQNYLIGGRQVKARTLPLFFWFFRFSKSLLTGIKNQKLIRQ